LKKQIIVINLQALENRLLSIPQKNGSWFSYFLWITGTFSVIICLHYLSHLKITIMKKFFHLIVISMFVLLMSCTDSTKTSTDNTGMSQADENLAKNRKVYKAIETGDAAVLDSLISSDAVDHQGPNGTEIKGTDSVKHMLADIHNHLKDGKFEVIADATNGDYIFTLARVSGTTADSSWGMPAGTKMDEKGVDVVKIKDGKMVEHWGFIDAAEMMKRMNK
jgi:ketosteroid isomerase-like protein